jgi:hypothetical protein
MPARDSGPGLRLSSTLSAISLNNSFSIYPFAIFFTLIKSDDFPLRAVLFSKNIFKIPKMVGVAL